MYAVADLKTVSSFLNYFTKQVQIVEFVAPEEVEALKLKPYISLCIGSKKNGCEFSKEKLNFFSSEAKPRCFYGKSNDRDDVFELPYSARLVFGSDDIDPFLFYNKTVLNIPTEDINSISTKNIDDEIKEATLNSEGQWIYSNNVDGVDMVSVSSLLFSVANLRAECIVDNDAIDLEKYGLEEPIYLLKIGFATDAGIQKSLLIGALAGDDGARYAMVKGKDIVFVLSPAELANLTLDIAKH
jgi:hypothetical protein